MYVYIDLMVFVYLPVRHQEAQPEPPMALGPAQRTAQVEPMAMWRELAEAKRLLGARDSQVSITSPEHPLV